jgi:hypothetical protein
MKKEVGSTGGSVSPVTQCNEAYASTEAKSQGPKIEITTVCSGQTPDGVDDLGKKGGGYSTFCLGRGKRKKKRIAGEMPRFILFQLLSITFQPDL